MTAVATKMLANVNAYESGEARTRKNQHIEFTCPEGKREEVRTFLADNVRTIDRPLTGQVNIPHGGYGRYTRYDIAQHKYAGGGYGDCGGYIEVLEIKNPPDSRQGFIIYEWRGGYGSTFTEWKTLDDALAVFQKFTFSALSKMPGFIRKVDCGDLIPWFYAIGNQLLIGDYAFPEDLQDDPVYTIGKKFIVEYEDGTRHIETCLGTRFVEGISDYPQESYHYRLVYFSNGSIWDERRSEKRPLPFQHGEEWICAAVNEFINLLNGRKTAFSIRFLDGSGLTCRLAGKAKRTACPEGRYDIVAHLQGEKPRKGWVDFKPSPEYPDVITYVRKHLEAKGGVVQKVKIVKQKTEFRGKKWVGTFFTS